jgi:hypothetical protein
VKQLSGSRSQIAPEADGHGTQQGLRPRYKVAGDRVKSAMMVQRDTKSSGAGGYFTMMIFPPESIRPPAAQSRWRWFTRSTSPGACPADARAALRAIEVGVDAHAAR